MSNYYPSESDSGLVLGHSPQHVRRRCGTETFEASERGDKNFEIFVGNDVLLENGDLITLEEWNVSEGKYTGRRTTKRVSYCINTNDSGIVSTPASENNGNNHGITIYGTVHPDYHSLKALLQNKYIFALIIETKEGSEENFEILTGPFYVPPISTPPLYELGILDELKIEKWPVGVYDLNLLVAIDIKRDRFYIVDHMISGVVPVENGQNTPPVENVQLSLVDLIAGKVRSVEGRTLELADPYKVKEIGDEINSGIDVKPEDLPLTVKDGMTSLFEGEVDGFLSEFEEENNTNNEVEKEESEIGDLSSLLY